MRRLQIITGHYGTGKTEYAVNLALSLAGADKKLALADLDIVKPLFPAPMSRPSACARRASA